MRVQLLLPIATLHGKLNGKAKFYFKTVNGKTFVQRCPDRSTGPVTESQLQARARFAAIAKEVKHMLDQGSKRTRKQLWKIASQAYDAANH